ncbi:MULTISPECIES: hypothetical protein [Halocynthiibacter]|uniref:Uncharacterized protein n=1 Tax=Halocynthiibacter halioticoli TaxID=2986804 RepID=A0AAE3J0W8_9RHOB|nr:MULTISPECIES: hypothetical protein [Halocynthiibacter]MCV6824101.1 hypothetical protein [Halocynthiibacter halioticoli]MCW4057102.1 hypothetical protein [Halocynthiibacter sp. SDUM655004]
MPKRTSRLFTHKLADALMLGAIAVFIILHLNGANLSKENGVLENAQVFVILCGALTYLLRALINFGAPYRAIQAYAIFMTAFLFAGAARELSFGKVFGFEPQVVDGVKYVVAALVVGLLLVTLWAYFRPTQSRWQQTKDLLRSRTLLHFYAAFLIFGIAGIFEKGDFGMIKSVFLEELLELTCFMALLRGALLLGCERLWKPRMDASTAANALQHPSEGAATSR